MDNVLSERICYIPPPFTFNIFIYLLERSLSFDRPIDRPIHFFRRFITSSMVNN